MSGLALEKPPTEQNRRQYPLQVLRPRGDQLEAARFRQHRQHSGRQARTVVRQDVDGRHGRGGLNAGGKDAVPHRHRGAVDQDQRRQPRAGCLPERHGHQPLRGLKPCGGHADCVEQHL